MQNTTCSLCMYLHLISLYFSSRLQLAAVHTDTHSALPQSPSSSLLHVPTFCCPALRPSVSPNQSLHQPSRHFSSWIVLSTHTHTRCPSLAAVVFGIKSVFLNMHLCFKLTLNLFEKAKCCWPSHSISVYLWLWITVLLLIFRTSCDLYLTSLPRNSPGQ